MKRIKLIIFVLSVVFLTGCEATYELNIDDNFTEKITVFPSSDLENSRMQGYSFNETAFYDSDDFSEDGEIVPGVEYYSRNYINNSLTHSYKFGKEYNRSYAAKTTFPSFRYDAAEESLIITSNDSRVFLNNPELTKLTVKITTSKDVITSNADRVEGNTYIWVFRKGEDSKSIYFKYIDPDHKGKKVTPKNNSNNNNNSNRNNSNSKTNQKSHKILLIFLCLFLSFLIIFGIISFGNKNKNN